MNTDKYRELTKQEQEEADFVDNEPYQSFTTYEGYAEAVQMLIEYERQKYLDQIREGAD